jgi:hypothetical protein
LASASAQQPASFVARTREVRYRIAPGGVRTVLSIDLGTVSRSSAGIVLWRHHQVVRGNALPDEAILTTPDGAVTRILWRTRQAVRLQDGRPGYQPPYSRASGRRVSMNGVECVIVPMHAQACAGGRCVPEPAALNNFGCVSPKYGITVHSEVQRKGETLETIHDTYDIVVREPDPATMRIPAGFARLRQILPLPPH